MSDLRPACPEDVPHTSGGGTQMFLHIGTKASPVSWLQLESGSNFGSGSEQLHQPPTLSNIVVLGGAFETTEAHAFPKAATPPSSPGAGVTTDRTSAIALGKRDWGGHVGELSITPTSNPHLGALDDITVFRWHAAGGDHALGINVWNPLSQNIQTLHALVDRLAPPLSRTPPTQPISHARGITMRPTPAWIHSLCSTPPMRPACPTMLPTIHLGFAFVTTSSGRIPSGRYTQISVEWTGTPKSREGTPPPNFGHFDITLGHVATAASYAAAKPLASIPLTLPNPLHPIPIGHPFWTRPAGFLIFGDCFANHLCYRWRHDGRQYQIDLHE